MINISEHEQSFLNAFLSDSPDPWENAKTEIDEELNKIFNNENHIPETSEEMRKELISGIIEYLSGCASYHQKRINKLFSFLSVTQLRYLAVLLEELTDSDVNEKHWQEDRVAPNLAALSEDYRPLSDYEIDDAIEQEISDGKIEQETDFNLSTWQNNEDDDSFTGELTEDVTSPLGTVIAQAMTPNSQKDLFAEPPTDKERWTQSGVDAP